MALCMVGWSSGPVVISITGSSGLSFLVVFIGFSGGIIALNSLMVKVLDKYDVIGW